MKYEAPYLGLQTVVTLNDRQVQVNTYAGENRGWLISRPVYRHEILKIKHEQNERLKEYGSQNLE